MLQGLNWFGFETSATMVAGLWAGSSSLTQDFKTVVWRMKLLGFNAVRLPFSFKVWPVKILPSPLDTAAPIATPCGA